MITIKPFELPIEIHVCSFIFCSVSNDHSRGTNFKTTAFGRETIFSDDDFDADDDHYQHIMMVKYFSSDDDDNYQH